MAAARTSTFLAALTVAAAVAGCFGGLEPPELRLSLNFHDATGVALYNATVWTADADRPRASAVAIVANRIVAVGSDEEVRGVDLGARPLHMDLEGRMVLPGFHDTHNHFAEVARAFDAEANPDVNPYEPWPPGWDPVVGTLNQQRIASGHIQTWAGNNADRVLAGETPAPPRLHGLEDHDHDGVVEAAGRLAAHDLWWGGPEQENPPEVWADLLRMGLATGARFGLTSHVEAGTSLDTFDVLERLDAAGALTARFNLYVFPEDLEAVIEKGWTTGSGDDDVRLLGMKIYSDGWLGPRTAALRELYSDRPHRGFAFFTQGEVDALALRAHQGGLKQTAHAIGDRAAEMMLAAYERAARDGCPETVAHPVCLEPRFSLEHVQLIPPDLVDRMAALDLVPSIQLSFATSDAPWVEQALGAERLEHAYPWRTLLDRGIRLGGSSDFPIEVLPPLWGVQRAVTRVDLDGQPPGGFMPAQALSVEAALRSITIDAAYLEYRDHELGSLTPGKLADLVVLEHDLFEVPAEAIAATQVHLTLVDGTPAWSASDLSVAFPLLR